MRKLPALAAALVLISTPTAFERDLLIDPAERLGWIGMADAIARVRFEGHRPIPSSDEALTQHTAVVLGIFKTHERLRVPATRIEIVERRGFMQTEDGDWPCWDNEQPLAEGTEAIAFLRWDRERRAFLLGFVVHVRFGEQQREEGVRQ